MYLYRAAPKKSEKFEILNCRLVRGGDNFKQLEFQLMRIKIRARHAKVVLQAMEFQIWAQGSLDAEFKRHER